MENQENMDKQFPIEKQGSKIKRIITFILISLSILIAVYFLISVYFINHFYFGSKINGVSVSCKSVGNVEKQMSSKLQSYTLSLKEREGKVEQISGLEIGMKYDPDGAFQNSKNRQNTYKWISSLFHSENTKIAIDISYDEKALNEKLDTLSCLDNRNITEPKNPIFKYTDSGYVIVDETNGNKVNKDVLYDNIKNAILNMKSELDLESADCYIKPQYTSKSQKVIEARDILNRYVSSKITYTFQEAKEVIDGRIINNWVSVDDNLDVSLDEGKVKDYISVLSNNYTAVGKLNNFKTSTGKTINVNEGDYNWMLDTSKEIQAISTAIKEGKNVTKELSSALTTYVEIDLTMQHLWFYKNSSLITQGDIVSGDMRGGNYITPEGVYKLKYRAKNAILRGPGYAAHVSFWMPFNGDIGIHDATWRSKFGGQIYKTDGSHGCINCPYDLAKTIFENINEGTAVVCYY